MSDVPSFKDSKGASWNVLISTTDARRLRAQLGVDVQDVFTGKLMDQLGADLFLFWDAIWLLCEEQAKSRNIDSEEFGRLMVGDGPLDGAHAALEEALVLWVPKLRRPALKKIFEKYKDVQEKMGQAATDLMSDQEVEAAIEKYRIEAMEKAKSRLSELGKDSTKLQPS